MIWDDDDDDADTGYDTVTAPQQILSWPLGQINQKLVWLNILGNINAHEVGNELYLNT